MSLVNKKVKIENITFEGIGNSWCTVLCEYHEKNEAYLLLETPTGLIRHIPLKYITKVLSTAENTIEKRLESIENLLRSQSVIGRKIIITKNVQIGTLTSGYPKYGDKDIIGTIIDKVRKENSKLEENDYKRVPLTVDFYLVKFDDEYYKGTDLIECSKYNIRFI